MVGGAQRVLAGSRNRWRSHVASVSGAPHRSKSTTAQTPPGTATSSPCERTGLCCWDDALGRRG